MGELTQALAAVGLSGIEVQRTFDPFLGTPKERTARHFQVQGVNVKALKAA